ncbi:PREDICTED: vitellogenin-1-like, partial [Wasmannia auropunctata]|uniref:vitellogenin-1-like n=1 Tax=Wasmannia auropunctata TaxID=64793 RepID=UPI0005F01F82
MWFHLTFVLVIGAAVANAYPRAWGTGNEYHYLIESRTFTVLNKLAGQYSGILIKGGLTIQESWQDRLEAVVSETRYATVNKVLLSIWDDIADIEFRELSLSRKPFEIKLKNGVIRDVLFDKDVPTWEVNLLKSIVSQLQIDIDGENVIVGDRKGNKMPDDNQPFGTFKVMEDSVGGKCEVIYNIAPVQYKDHIPVSLPSLDKDGRQFGITKTKNYNRCEQRMAYHSGIIGKMKPESNDELFTRSSTSNIIISGNLKRFTIKSSVMTDEIVMNSKIHDTYSGAVYSSMNLTLVKTSLIANPMRASNVVSTGNLVYTYNNPFSSQLKRSSSSSSSSSSNSEEHDYLQPKPKLDEAPESPLLPYFIGYNGRSIQTSEENYDVVAARLISQITEEIEYLAVDLLKHPFTETLERFTILVRLIRTMNTKQIGEVEYNLLELVYHDNRKDKVTREEDQKLYNQTLWDVFRHAIADAGTGPALITIKNWIKNGKLEGIQAAQIISKIPKTALAPTAEYLTAFFELITDEQVTQQKFLNTTAPLAFAELARYTLSNKSYIYYPIYSFGRTAFKHDNAILEKYIPYMGVRLREAIKKGDSRQIQTYIMTLGNFGHPKILSIFEPHLEGTLPVSKFQRLMMVKSLNKLSENFPRVARSVAYKIYINVMEAYEIRCAAVYIIMKTNPPMSMLQRMAEFTNQDENPHVNSAVKTSINALADLEQPEWKELADKARIASKSLKSDIDVENYSQSIFKKMKISSLNTEQTAILQTISSDDSVISRDASIDIYQSYGGFNLPLSRLSYATSSIKSLINIWYQMPWMSLPTLDNKKLIIVETIEKLGIKPEDAEPFEGNIFFDSPLGSDFHPYDNQTFEEIINMFMNYVASMQMSPLQVFESKNINRLYHYDMTLGFPTETGLPFVYTLTIPQLMRISREGSHQVTISQTEHFMELKAAGHMILNEKSQSRIGFVTPFENRHYIAGIDVNTQLFIPAGLSIKYGATKKLELKIQPREYYQYGVGHAAIHHSVVPYTAKHDILDFQPVILSNDTRLVHTKEPHGMEFSLGGVTFTAKADLIDSEAAKKTGIEAATEFCQLFYKNLGARYRSFDIILSLKEAEINMTYNQGILNNVRNSSEATIPASIDKRPQSEARKEQFQQEISKDINYPNSFGHIFDISVLADNNYHVFTLAVQESFVKDKLQALFYWNVQSPNGNVFSEFCAVGYKQSTQSFPLNFEKAIEKIPNYEYKAEMRFGNCANGETIRLKGNWTRTDDVVKMAMKSDIVEKCRQEIKQGNIWLPTCRKASELVELKDLLKISINTNSDRFFAFANAMILKIADPMMYNNETKSNSRRLDKNTIDMEIKLSIEDDDAKISLRTSQTDLAFSLSNIFESPEDISLKKCLKKKLQGSVCALDKTKVVTFDEKVYPLKLGKCWHVMMTTYPKRNPLNPEETLSIREDMSVIVMAREMDDSTKQIRIILNEDQEIYLQKSNDRLEATVNGQPANTSNHDKVVVEIYQLDGMIVVYSLYNQIYAVYDGERVLLYVSKEIKQ